MERLTTENRQQTIVRLCKDTSCSRAEMGTMKEHSGTGESSPQGLDKQERTGYT